MGAFLFLLALRVGHISSAVLQASMLYYEQLKSLQYDLR